MNMLKMMKALDNCPCGSDVLEFGESFTDETVEVRCKDCGRTTEDCASEEEAIARWNSRTAEELETAECADEIVVIDEEED